MLGCPNIIALQNKRDHEHHCKFSLSFCKWVHKGCKYQGTKDQIEIHLTSNINMCPFEILKDVVNIYDIQIKSLQQQLLVTINILISLFIVLIVTTRRASKFKREIIW